MISRDACRQPVQILLSQKAAARGLLSRLPTAHSFFVSEKSDDAKSLKTSGEPGRTRTCNPLIKSPKRSDGRSREVAGSGDVTGVGDSAEAPNSAKRGKVR